MPKSRLSSRFRYTFDNIMAKGASAMLVLLGIVALAFLLILAGFVWYSGIAPEDAKGDFLQIFWMSLMRTLDSGTMGGDSGYFGLVMLLVTMVGIFIISALIGIINNGIEAKMEEIRKGRSEVIEKNHTIIYGWTEQIFTIVSELLTAKESQSKACIVVMSEKDKTEMDDELHSRFPKHGRTKLVTRQGCSSDMADVRIPNPDSAHSIIVLSPETENPDSEVIKTLLAITNNPDRKQGPYHIVAEIRDPKNLEVAKMVGKDEVELVLVGDIISRIIAQTCRQSGLSVVYNELLDYGGDEMYIVKEPALIGKTYGAALDLYAECAIAGIVTDGQPAQLNPPMNHLLTEKDSIVVIAKDDSAVVLPKTITKLPMQEDSIVEGKTEPAKPEKTLVLGWNWRAPIIINELDNYVAPGSSLDVVADSEEAKDGLAAASQGVVKNQALHFLHADTTDRKTLDKLRVEQYNHIILLCYTDSLSIQQADAKTLITLLHLRDISEKKGVRLTIVSEMADIRNRNLAEVAKVNDFIVSDKLISLMLTQISENKSLNSVFADMFDPDGAEIYIKPVENYVVTGRPVNFQTVVEAARRRNETAIGWKIASEVGNAELSYGVRVNPKKADIVTFVPGDRIIVFSDN